MIFSRLIKMSVFLCLMLVFSISLTGCDISSIMNIVTQVGGLVKQIFPKAAGTVDKITQVAEAGSKIAETGKQLFDEIKTNIKDTKTADTKTDDTKPADTKTDDTKPADTKTDDTKTADTGAEKLDEPLLPTDDAETTEPVDENETSATRGVDGAE